MPSTNNVKQVKMNIMTQAQYDAATKNPTELYMVVDADVVTIDNALSTTSTNPVENRVITNALNAKQATLVSGTNIKTINNNSILGSGNITVSGGTWGDITGTLSNQTDLQNALDGKLDLTGGTMSGSVTITGEYGTTEIGGGFISAHSATAGHWDYVFSDNMMNLQFGSTNMSFDGTAITIDADEDVYIYANYLSIPTSSSDYANIGNEEAISAGWLKTNAMPLKQDTLVSGTNIKTINGSSILGSGNLVLDGLPSQTGQSGKFLTTDGTNASWATVTIPTPSYDSVNERITW